MGLVIQLSWILDPHPGQLPILLMVSGLALLLFGGLRRTIQSSASGLQSRPAKIALLTLSVGYLLLALAVLQESYPLYGAYLFIIFKGVEGAAAARFYRKVAYVLRNRTLSGGTRIRDRVYHLGLVFSIILAGAGFVVYLSTSGYENVYSTSLMIYTVVLVSISALGVWWRLQMVSADYATPTLVGFVLCITGGQTFGYATLTREILVMIAGSVAFAVGFWALIGVWVTGAVSRNGFNWV